MTTAEDWQNKTGKVWADNYARTDRAMAGLTQQLLERLASVPGRQITDIGCGAGELSLALARARPTAEVIGLDISPDLIEAARNRGHNLRNATFLLADAAIWRPDGKRPDLLVSRHGTMFFPDPVAAFSNLYKGMADEGCLAFTCFRSFALNPWAAEPAVLLGLPRTDTAAPGPFAFAEDDRLRAILNAAGWRDVVIEPVDFAFVTGVGPDAIDDALEFVGRIGPVASALRTMGPQEREAAVGRLRQWLARQPGHESAGVVAFPAAAWFVSAAKRG